MRGFTTDSVFHTCILVNEKDAGFGGVVRNSFEDPAPLSTKVKISGPGVNNVIVLTDDNGYYTYLYKYTGKSVTFTISLPDYPTVAAKQFTVKSNSFVVTNFTIP